MYKCPKCGSKGHFDIYVEYPIWTINFDGDKISTNVYSPDDYDPTECKNCGYVAKLYEFYSMNFEADEE